jgi:hypothetical protein
MARNDEQIREREGTIVDVPRPCPLVIGRRRAQHN